MRIFNLFLSIVIALALVFVMLQNSVTIADVKVFQYSFTAQKLSYILLASFIVCILFGFVYMLYPSLMNGVIVITSLNAQALKQHRDLWLHYSLILRPQEVVVQLLLAQ